MLKKVLYSLWQLNRNRTFYISLYGYLSKLSEDPFLIFIQYRPGKRTDIGALSCPP